MGTWGDRRGLVLRWNGCQSPQECVKNNKKNGQVLWSLTTCWVALEPGVLELRAYCFHAAFDIEQKWFYSAADKTALSTGSCSACQRLCRKLSSGLSGPYREDARQLWGLCAQSLVCVRSISWSLSLSHIASSCSAFVGISKAPQIALRVSISLTISHVLNSSPAAPVRKVGLAFFQVDMATRLPHYILPWGDAVRQLFDWWPPLAFSHKPFSWRFPPNWFNLSRLFHLPHV